MPGEDAEHGIVRRLPALRQARSSKRGKVFQCSTNRREKQSDGTWRTTEGCGWRAWTTVAGKTITDTTMRRLLDGRKVSLKGFTSRKGGTFDAALVIDKDKGVALRLRQ